jgi:hypothetical protein
MILAVHQPQYLPWLGYFDKIKQCDCFVFLDEVQYKEREFQNRNKIRTKNGWMWLTVPVLKNEVAYPDIDKVYIDNHQDWAARHWKAIRTNYARAPYFKRYCSFFEELYKKEWQRLIDLNIYIIHHFNKLLGLDRPIHLESELGIKTTRTQRIIDICRVLKADTYLSGIGGKAYLEEGVFNENNIKLLYQEFQHPQYRQCYEPFIPLMSVIDLLFNHGEDSAKILFAQKDSGNKPLSDTRK